MRILLTIIKSLLVLSILGAIVFVGGREGLLFYTQQSLGSDLQKLRSIDIQPGGYYTQCKQLGSLSDIPLESLQLRFSDERSYNLEVVCAGGRFDPIVIASGQLPPFVTKQAGSSGILWGDDTSGIVVEVFGRTRAIIVEDRQVFGGSPQQLYLGKGPATSCEAYGYSCCVSDVAAGIGELKTNTTDCRASCYASCEARPIILSFRAGSLSSQGKEIKVRPGEEVEFYWVVDPGETNEFTGTIAFGDKEFENFSDDESSTTHTYSCSTGRCEYMTQIGIKNSNGVTSFINETTSIKVIVE